jgi:hypothetical protein
MVAGFWFGSIGGNIPGNKFVNFILLKFPDTYLVFGFPLILIIGGEQDDYNFIFFREH